MDPRYMDNLEKNTFKPCTPTMKKKNCETKGCILSLLNLVQFHVVARDVFAALYLLETFSFSLSRQ